MRNVLAAPDRLAAVIVSILLAFAVFLLVAAGPAQAQDPNADGSGAKTPKAPKLDASSWILIDARNGDRLAARAPTAERSIASTTKLMTTYLALQSGSLERLLTVPSYQALPAESVAGLIAGERLTVRDLIVAMMLPSANDAAATVAKGLAGSESEFVERMNDAAVELGLDDSSFANPIGLDDPLNYSSAQDLADLTRELRREKTFRKVVAMDQATLHSGSTPRTLTTRNTLMLSDPSVDGVKTGHTIKAGYVLVASAKRKGIPLISVVLNASSEAARDTESEELLDYGYSLYEKATPVKADTAVGSTSVRYEDEPLALLAGRAVQVRVRADEKLATEVEAPDEVEGPIERGERLGTATVTLDGERVGKVPALAAKAIGGPTIIDKIGGPGVAAAILIVVIVILLALVLLMRRRAEDAREERTRSPDERMKSRHERVRRRGGD